MTTHTVLVAFDHELVYERKACRGQRNDRVRATMPVSIREVDEAECPVVLKASLASHVSTGVPHIQERVYRRLGASLVSTPRNWVGKPLTLEDLSPSRSHHAGHLSPWQGPYYPFRTFAGESFPEESLRVRRVIRDDRTETEHAVRRMARGVAVTPEGHLLVPCHEPVWVVRRPHEPDGSPVVAALICGDRLPLTRLPSFRADRSEAALRYASHVSDGAPMRMDGSLEILDRTSLRYEDMRLEAGIAFKAILEPGLGDGFHLLPPDALLAWAAFRREVQAHVAGNRDALHGAFGHLSDMVDRIGHASSVADALLARVSAPLFRYREIDLPELGREAALTSDDEEALGGLAAAG